MNIINTIKNFFTSTPSPETLHPASHITSAVQHARYVSQRCGVCQRVFTDNEAIWIIDGKPQIHDRCPQGALSLDKFPYNCAFCGQPTSMSPAQNRHRPETYFPSHCLPCSYRDVVEPRKLTKMMFLKFRADPIIAPLFPIDI